VLYDIGHSISFPQLPWLVFLLVGLASATGLSIISAKQRKADTARPPATTAPAPVQESERTGAALMGDAAK
jgi:hypothetical protein